MISVIHTEHARISAISNLWHARYPAEWRRMLAVANLLDVPLLALIYQRLRELQDGVAREAFERQEDFGVVAWKWRQRIVGERSALMQRPERPHELNTPQLAAITHDAPSQKLSPQ